MFSQIKKRSERIPLTMFVCVFGCLTTIMAGADDSNSPQTPVNTTPTSVAAFPWQEVKQDERVPVQQAYLDRDGYRVQADNGATIAVPFVNDDLNVMKFARSDSAQTYFVNKGDYPVLYLAKDSTIASSAAQNARWAPITQQFNYSSPPVFVEPAPDWETFQAMGWAPNMTINGGYYGINPGVPFAWMHGYYVRVGVDTYTTWGAYNYWYLHTPNLARSPVIHINPFSPRTTQWPAPNQHFSPPNLGGAGQSRAAGPAGGTTTESSGLHNRNFGGSGKEPHGPGSGTGTQRPETGSGTGTQRPGNGTGTGTGMPRPGSGTGSGTGTQRPGTGTGMPRPGTGKRGPNKGTGSRPGGQ